MHSENKVYSGWDALPSGHADDSITPGCLVLEGGAFRGVYTSGVLDAFMQENLNFECTVGVSAGAMNGFNYVAGQIGRSARVNLKYRHDSRYVGKTAVHDNHGVIGFDFLLGDYCKEDPFDNERFFRDDRRFYAVCTNCETGKAEYFEKSSCGDIFRAVQASASMPYVSKPVEVDGVPCLDGGCRCKIPVKWALDQGFDKIIVVKTRVRSYRRKEGGPAEKLPKALYSRYPALARDLATGNERSNRQLDAIDRLEKKGRIFVIAPSVDLEVSRLEKDMEKLGALYHLGYDDAKQQIPALRKYLE